ncbi:MAG TPA: peptide deformylase [Mycobacteriales bacterium]|nr:peptide deformylase [Mycobacteriales bacterium]
MTVRPILRVGDPALREVARSVTRGELAAAEVQTLVDDLVDTMRAADGAGLAATQVGVALRVAVVEVRQPNPRYPYKPAIPLTVLVNPVVTPLGDETWGVYEGCLSVPGLRGEVARFTEVRVQAWDRDGNDVDLVARGVTAGTYQHELDHLDGRLFLDRVTDTTTLCTWEEFDRWHRAAFVARAEAMVARFGQ